MTAIAPVVGTVNRGDVLLAHFWIRCDDSMTGEGYTTFCYELNHPEFNKAAQFKISASKDWKEVFVPFVAQRNYADGVARIAFWAGYDRQTVDLGGIEVINYESKLKLDDLPATKVTYIGRATDAPWRAEALKRIEQIRKGNLDVYVTNAQGTPIPARPCIRSFAVMRLASEPAWMSICFSRNRQTRCVTGRPFSRCSIGRFLKTR